MRSIRWAFAVLAAMLCLAGARAEDKLWTEDFAAALEKAEKDKKDVLLDFTGSDWCHWCVQLKGEVFDQEAFKKAAPEHFVLVELDFPRGKEQNEAVKQQNKMLAQTFGIEGFPTVILLDGKGRPYAKTGYQPGGAEKFLEHLAGLRQKRAARDELFAKADAAQGAEKAKHLDEALQTVSAQVGSLAGYDEVVEQILAADAENQGGFKTKYGGLKTLKDLESEHAKGAETAAVMAKLDEFLAETKPAGDLLQRALLQKAMLLNDVRVKEMVANLKQALAAAPEGPKAQEIQGILMQLGAQPDQ
ncbi:MAG: thioredoxin family protein [Planctomycetota bacterium]|nr:thioredoxin family protein [Planctomycetota bacterium]